MPFNREMNRFTLVVKNLSAPGAEAMWGASRKTITRAELEAGVNLAEAFADNPFSALRAASARLLCAAPAQRTEIKLPRHGTM